jgi:hypothetical protein
VLPKSAGARGKPSKSSSLAFSSKLIQDGSSAFTIVYLSFSIVNFAILLAFIRSTALEALKERYKARERRTLERIKTRHSSLLEHHSKGTTLLIYLSLGLYHPQHTKAETLESRSTTSQFKEERSERRKQKHYAYEEKIEELNRDQRIEFRSQVSPVSRFLRKSFSLSLIASFLPFSTFLLSNPSRIFLSLSHVLLDDLPGLSSLSPRLEFF